MGYIAHRLSFIGLSKYEDHAAAGLNKQCFKGTDRVEENYTGCKST